MNHLFGKLRSLLHSEAPSRSVWRLIWRIIDRAPADYAAETLVPYANMLLDQQWPDHLRVAPTPWLHMLTNRAAPHHGWPLVRALLMPRDSHAVDALRDNPALLAPITTLLAHEAYGRNTPLSHLLAAPALRLKRLDSPFNFPADDALDALLLRQPDLEHLSLGGWNMMLPTPPHLLDLPRLRTLHLNNLRLTPEQTHDLLHRARLPALRDLAINLLGDARRDTLRTAPLIAQLDRLTIHQFYNNQQTCVATDLLHALPHDKRLDALTLHGTLSVAGALDALLAAPIAAPGHLTLSTMHLEDADRARLAAWSGMQRLTHLTLHSAFASHQHMLSALLTPQAMASLEELTITANHAADLPALLAITPMPALHTLRLDDCALPAWRAGAPDHLPALTTLDTHPRAVSADQLDQLAAQPWLPRLTDLIIHPHMPLNAPDHHAGLIGQLAASTALQRLSLRHIRLDADALDDLSAAPLPALRSLTLPALDGLDALHLAHLDLAPWLPQLAHLDLPLKHVPSLARRNLRAELRRAGLPRTAHVSY